MRDDDLSTNARAFYDGCAPRTTIAAGLVLLSVVFATFVAACFIEAPGGGSWARAGISALIRR